MSEERWAQQQEWDEEKRRGFDVEINDEKDVTGGGEKCHVSKCGAPAVKLYEIKNVGEPGHGWDVLLCVDHDHRDTAFEIYQENN